VVRCGPVFVPRSSSLTARLLSVARSASASCVRRARCLNPRSSAAKESVDIKPGVVSLPLTIRHYQSCYIFVSKFLVTNPA
jgi:hypothetical protein